MTVATGQKGIDVRQTANRLMFRILVQDAGGIIVTTGTVSLRILEVQSDGSYKTYDFADNTFKATTVGTETATMVHQTCNNGATDTGLWTYVLTTLTGFTVGAIYKSHITSSLGSPAVQVREWQFGGEQGDAVMVGTDGRALLSANAQDLSATLDVNAKLLNSAIPENLSALNVWTYVTRTLTSFDTLIANTWSYVTRTLTNLTQVSPTMISGTELTILRGDTVSLTLTVSAMPTNPDKVWFGVKRKSSDPDSEAIILIENGTGIIYLGSQIATTPLDGSIAYVDATHVDLLIKAPASKQLLDGRWKYDIQVLKTGVVTTVGRGDFVIEGDVVNKIS